MIWDLIFFWRKKKTPSKVVRDKNAVITTMDELLDALRGSDGKSIRLGPGVFTGSFKVTSTVSIEGAPYPEGGTPLTLLQSSDPVTLTVSDACNLRNIAIRNLAQDGVALDIKEGDASLEACEVSAGLGTALRVTNADPSFVGCRIVDSRIGALFRERADPWFENCLIEGNRVLGVQVTDGADPTFTSTRIAGQDSAGAISFEEHTFGLLRQCVIGGTAGIGIRVHADASPEILDCTIEGQGVAAVSFEDGSLGSLDRCRFEPSSLKRTEVRVHENARVFFQETPFPPDALQIGLCAGSSGEVLAVECSLGLKAPVADDSVRVHVWLPKSHRVTVRSAEELRHVLSSRTTDTLIELEEGIYEVSAALLQEVQRAPISLCGKADHPKKVLLKIEVGPGLLLQAGSRLKNLSVESQDLIAPAISILGSSTLDGVRVTARGESGVRAAGNRTQAILTDTWISNCQQQGVLVAEGARALLRHCLIARNVGHGVVVQDPGSWMDLYHCRIRDQADGLGVKFHRQASGVIRRCYIFRNHHHGVQMGSGPGAELRVIHSKVYSQNEGATGILVGDQSVARLLFVEVTGNKSAGLAAVKSTVYIDRSWFIRNQDLGILLQDKSEARIQGGAVSKGSKTGIQVSKESKLKCQACVIEYNHVGILVTDQGSAELRDVILVSNRFEGARLEDRSVLSLSGSKLIDGGVGLVLIHECKAQLKDCEIAGNSEGGVAVIDNSMASLEKCKLKNNRNRGEKVAVGSGAVVAGRSKAEFRYCVFCDNVPAGAVVKEGGNSSFTRCTFVEHNQVCLSVVEGGSADVEQCIFEGNEGLDVSVDESGQVRRS